LLNKIFCALYPVQNAFTHEYFNGGVIVNKELAKEVKHGPDEDRLDKTNQNELSFCLSFLNSS